MSIILSPQSSRRKRHSAWTTISMVVGGAFLGTFLLRSISSQPVQQQVQQKPIVVSQFDSVVMPVPASPITAGTKLKDVAFNYTKYPSHQIPDGAIKDVTAYLEYTTLTSLPAGFPITPGNISQSYSVANPVIDRIPSGMRAMTIKVDATSAVEGWAGSGSVVDVLLVTNDKTTVVAEKVKILSAERSVSPVDGNNLPNVPSTVTLLVSQEQCLAINTAIPLGRIAFALRSASDDESWRDTTYTAQRLKGGAVKDKKNNSISGFVRIKEKNKDTEQFALADGRWIRSKEVPEGFFPKEN